MQSPSPYYGRISFSESGEWRQPVFHEILKPRVFRGSQQFPGPDTTEIDPMGGGAFQGIFRADDFQNHFQGDDGGTRIEITGFGGTDEL